MRYIAVYNVSIFRSISVLSHNIPNNCWVIYFVISNSGIIIGTSRNDCPMWHIFKLYTEINNDFGRTSCYKHLPQKHVQNTYTEIAQFLHDGEL